MKITRKDKRTLLEKEIDSVIESMSAVDPDTDEYCKMAENLERLYRAKGNDRAGISSDTIAIIAGNLVGIAMILWHERAEIITTKALGFVIKGRV